jgi:hypothetical protein
MKSGNLNFLEPSGPLQAFNGTDLPLPLPIHTSSIRKNGLCVWTLVKLIVSRFVGRGGSLTKYSNFLYFADRASWYSFGELPT